MKWLWLFPCSVSWKHWSLQGVTFVSEATACVSGEGGWCSRCWRGGKQQDERGNQRHQVWWGSVSREGGGPGRVSLRVPDSHPSAAAHTATPQVRSDAPNNNSNKKKENCVHRRNLRFFAISLLRCEPFPTRTLKWPGHNHVQITCNTSSVCHMQNVMLRATWYKRTAQLLSLTDFKSHLFELYFIGWTVNQWQRGGNWSTRRKPLVTSFRKCHLLKPEDSRPKWDSNPHNSIGDRLEKQTC